MNEIDELNTIIEEIRQEGVVPSENWELVARKRLEIRKFARMVKEKSKPLVDELNAKGYKVESVWDLDQEGYDILPIVPMLLRHFQLPYPRRTREGILKALNKPELSKMVVNPLIRLFISEQDKAVQIGIGGVLARICEPEHTDDLVKLATNANYGEARHFLPRGIARIQQQKAIPILVDLLDQKDFGAEVIEALGEVGGVDAAALILPFTKDKDSYVRSIAKKAYKKCSIGKVSKCSSMQTSGLIEADFAYETSGEFDLDDLGPFLELAQSTFALSIDAKLVMDSVESANVNEEIKLSVRTKSGKYSAEILLKILKEDEDVCSIFLFSGSKITIKRWDTLLNQLMNGLKKE
ncbi:HEAT repeat domain-containing protein [Pseudomaricurvus alcaniphilus]|uniref:HEAT repeat domain-containing protein n=1 Tax=Pseudomaricurvus alcaniphilus TaxID=1166482 RepID=UPI00140D8477|nr:HEAT repeat domain-containing protein [Pseudomaricurvus alcaniphilus]NHN35922.1 HEAT repeat domain-containing protein [Pseudomaricurvus alcaniphilus]